MLSSLLNHRDNIVLHVEYALINFSQLPFPECNYKHESMPINIFICVPEICVLNNLTLLGYV